jgi:NADPH:quinone reductase-like Zn-dependent oxidoreductase
MPSSAISRAADPPLLIVLQKVVRSAVIDAPIDRVWAVLRDFNSHDAWHDIVQTSRIEAGRQSAEVGCVRAFTLADGSFIREQLLALDDSSYRFTYCIVEATVPLERYVSTVTLKPVTDGNRTFWHWESSFGTPPGRERELAELVATGVYEAGFANLRRYLEQGGDRRTKGQVPMPAALPLPSDRVELDAYGGHDVMRLRRAEVAAPGPGEVRIRQRVIGVNYFDVYLRRGWIPGLLPLPGTPGMEAAGSVIDIGESVAGLMPADRVAYMGPAPGAYASVRCVPQDWVVRLPAHIEDEVAAAVLLKGITADYLLQDLGHIRPGQRWLVHAAAGGVGLLLCSWASHLGARVIGTVSSPDKARLARDHGCEHVIVTSDYRFATEVQAVWGGGAEVIVDGLGEAAFEENFAALAACGHWISLGQASGAPRAISADLLVSKSASFSRPVAFAYVATRQKLAERADRLWSAIADGSVRVPPIERHALAAASRAHERLESRRTTGALVLTA